ncbi:MAG: hypothetical protein WBF84_12140 [Castellaniella sp.]|uniref:hypothetical protein n=1 Tax=Castellaniella sp. TaxID=1955812 RepID=UPI003C709E62
MSIPTIISLGRACRTRFQIDAFLSRKYESFKKETYFFDWLMRGGSQGVAFAFKNNLTFNQENIKILEINNQFLPVDTITKFAFLHDFGEHQWFHSEEDCRGAIARGIDAFLERYAYLGKKTINHMRSAEKLLLVYHGRCESEDFYSIKSTISGINRNFNFANFIEFGETHRTHDPAVINLFVHDNQNPKKGTADEWKGDDASWGKAFTEVFDQLDWH